MARTILHSDANCFYASVEMLYHPEYAGYPLAVGGDPEARHGIVLTANYVAKKKGVKTGAGTLAGKNGMSGSCDCSAQDGLVSAFFFSSKRNLWGIY